MPASPPMFELPPVLRPELDCNRRLGKDCYSFSFPIEISDFVVVLWTRIGGAEDADGFAEWKEHARGSKLVKYAISVYENGRMVILTDARFRGKTWAGKLLKSWSEEVFVKDEVDVVLEDLWRMSRAAQATC